jgi:hypothetical protein
MKKFRFPLERVRHYRQVQLEVEEAKLEQLFVRLRELDRFEKELEAQLRASEDDVRLCAARGEAEPALLAAMADFRDFVRRMGDKIQTARRQLEIELGQQRLRVVRASQNVKILDKLKSARRKEWQAEVDREIETVASENFLARWNRSSGA